MLDDELNVFQKAILMRFHKLCNFSTKCHVPEEAIFKGIRMRRMDKYSRRELKKAFRRLLSKGYIGVKKAGRSRDTYFLTEKGIDAIKEILRELTDRSLEKYK